MDVQFTCRTCILAAIQNVNSAKQYFNPEEYTVFELMIFINELEHAVKELKAWITRR